jgi:hypothetical protein
MALTDIALCARALIRIGAAPIAGFGDGTAEAEVASALYPVVRDALLSAHPWSFATAQATLARLDDVPAADFAHVHQLPADFLRAVSSGRAGSGRGLVYRIAGDRLESDADAVVLTYLRRVEETAFPPFFDLALIARLSAEFCIPLTESTSRAETLFRLAEAEFRRARLIDAQQDGQPGFEDFALIEARGS